MRHTCKFTSVAIHLELAAYCKEDSNAGAWYTQEWLLCQKLLHQKPGHGPPHIELHGTAPQGIATTGGQLHRYK
eukprot:COSAG05_NODE_19393_length_293_cov_1.056701_1_plen_73_part_10